MIRFTLTTFAAAMLALSMSGARTSACDASDPTCGGRTVPVLIADCNPSNPNCDRPVPVLIADCNVSDPTCGGRIVPVTKMA